MSEQEIKTAIHTYDLFPVILSILHEGQNAVFTISGMSMWPFLCHNRDQVVLERCDPASLHFGDIVLFQTPLQNYMLHRITAVNGNSFETTGDGNCFRDGWFDNNCVKAKAVYIIRNGKRIDYKRLSWHLIFIVWNMLFPIRKYLLRFFFYIGKVKRMRKLSNRK